LMLFVGVNCDAKVRFFCKPTNLFPFFFDSVKVNTFIKCLSND